MIKLERRSSLWTPRAARFWEVVRRSLQARITRAKTFIEQFQTQINETPVLVVELMGGEIVEFVKLYS